MEPYLKELESFLLDASMKRCVLIAHAKAITYLVNVALAFKDRHSKIVQIENISIGTIRSITVNREQTKNVSFMKLVLAKRETLKE